MDIAKTQITLIKKLMLRKDRDYVIFFDRRTGVTDEMIDSLLNLLKERGIKRIIAGRVDDVDGIKVMEKPNGN